MIEIDYKTNIGIANELFIIEAINGEKVKNVNFLFQELFYSFFKNIDGNDVIHAYKGQPLEKTDVVVKINNQTMNISVKMGFRNSAHCENIYYFLQFLKELRIPYDIINKYLAYHYADGTLNGTGIERLSAEEYKKSHQEEIDLINKYFNNSKNMEKIANRFLFRGTNLKNSLVDIILWGKADDFLWVTRDEILEYLKDSCNLYMTCPHFGRLSVQPSSRCLNRNPDGERRRKQVGIKWYNIFDSLIEIMNNSALKKVEKDFYAYWDKLYIDIMNNKYQT